MHFPIEVFIAHGTALVFFYLKILLKEGETLFIHLFIYSFSHHFPFIECLLSARPCANWEVIPQKLIARIGLLLFSKQKKLSFKSEEGIQLVASENIAWIRINKAHVIICCFIKFPLWVRDSLKKLAPSGSDFYSKAPLSGTQSYRIKQYCIFPALFFKLKDTILRSLPN